MSAFLMLVEAGRRVVETDLAIKCDRFRITCRACTQIWGHRSRRVFSRGWLGLLFSIDGTGNRRGTMSGLSAGPVAGVRCRARHNGLPEHAYQVCEEMCVLPESKSFG
jgi:hypothetical protein